MPLPPARPRRAVLMAGLAAGLWCAATVLAPAPAGADSTYTVRPGDTLSGISTRTGASVAALTQANGLSDPNHLVAGTTLTIPRASSSSGGGMSGNQPTGNTSAAGYTVRAGDTWSGIAARYSMRAGQLAAANGATVATMLHPGDRLTVPALDVAPGVSGSGATVSYTVKAGDTLSRDRRPPRQLGRRGWRGANGIAVDGVLRIGATLQVPRAGTAAAAAPNRPAPSAAAAAGLPAAIRNDPDRLALLAVFDAAAAEFGVPADLLKSVGWMESGWRSDVISYVGAMGVGQLMPDTAAEMASWSGRARPRRLGSRGQHPHERPLPAATCSDSTAATAPAPSPRTTRARPRCGAYGPSAGGDPRYAQTVQANRALFD